MTEKEDLALIHEIGFKLKEIMKDCVIKNQIGALTTAHVMNIAVLIDHWCQITGKKPEEIRSKFFSQVVALMDVVDGR